MEHGEPMRVLCFGALLLIACSGELREKPQLDCQGDVTANVCSDGIIGSCVGRSPQYRVCGDTTVCSASWQQAGAYKCTSSAAAGDAGAPIYSGSSTQPLIEALAVRVVSETNGDGVMSPGEEGRFRVEVRNSWLGTARMVTGTLSTSQPGVTITSGAKLFFGDLESGVTACGVSSASYTSSCSETYWLPNISVAKTVSPTASIELQLTVRDADANEFGLSFQVALGAIDQTFRVSTLTVVEDSNADGVVSPGETATLKVPLNNSGSSSALGIEGTVTTSQAGVTIADGSKLYFGMIDGGATVCGSSTPGYAGDCNASYYLLKVQVAATVAATTIVPFLLQLEDAVGNTSTATFELTLGAIDQTFSVSTITIVRDSNADGAVSPGETAQLRVPVTNSGGSGARGVVGTVITNELGVSVEEGFKLYFGDIESGATACGTSTSGYAGDCSQAYYVLKIEVESSVPAGTTIPFDLDLSDSYSNRFANKFSILTR
jgi:hypothetical protein